MFLPDETKRLIVGVTLILIAVIITLSFFGLAGGGGRAFMKISNFLFGKAIFILPLLFVLGGLALFGLKSNNKWPILLATILLILGVSGSFETFGQEAKQGGWVGYLAALPLTKLFSRLVTQIIFMALIVLGAVIFWQFIYKPKLEGKQVKITGNKNPLIRKIFGPKFRVKPLDAVARIEEVPQIVQKAQEKAVSNGLEFRTKPLGSMIRESYKFPPLDLLEPDRGEPLAGDIRINSAIIKRTFQNFNIQVEMSEVNIGPTVTQYTMKPAEGVKLSQITSLYNDLSLALAAHPVRIEAPIPGRPLVGIEVPNKTRTTVRLKNLIEDPSFQNSISNLNLVLGRDVAGNPVFADLARMPHLLVAGATGTGKTICLNSIITSLLYQNSPEILRLILIDPKRVEFPVFNDLPHLLTPVIFDAQKTINALKWLVSEMERRFDVLSQGHARDIVAYNENMLKEKKDPLPYIVLVVDELADLMAARGREVEAGIVRLAQMARAVGIHLIVATQRPSVEVITGLIKANITSRITFQVASQVDSRTVLDASGAEKLLGAGDMLFISAEVSKPKRIQGVYVSDKEVKKVAKYVVTENKEAEKPENLEITEAQPNLSESLGKSLEDNGEFGFSGEEDPLYEEAKRVVIEARKASASLLQRRLRLGYARAARLIDTLEGRGVVGPGEGAKPREILISTDAGVLPETGTADSVEQDWKKV